MRLLLMDTCGASGSVALAEGGVVVASKVLPGRSASERLVPVVRALLEDQGWGLGELTAIVMVHGPGSFTGMRIGLSAAKGLSEAVRVPLVAVSRLAVLAGMATFPPFAKGAKDGAPAPGVYSALDAGRGEFYLRDAAGVELLVTLQALQSEVGGGEVVVCEERLAGVVLPTLGDEAAEGGTPGKLRVRVVAEPVAGDALGIALERVATGRFDDTATVDANYLRRGEGLYGRTVSG